jgi:hypothetical protein
VAVVREWQEKTGKSWSETVSLLILAGVGNLRLMRHPAASPLQALRFAEKLYRDQLTAGAQAEVHRHHKEALDDLERLLAPPAA